MPVIFLCYSPGTTCRKWVSSVATTRWSLQCWRTSSLPATRLQPSVSDSTHTCWGRSSLRLSSVRFWPFFLFTAQCLYNSVKSFDVRGHLNLWISNCIKYLKKKKDFKVSEQDFNKWSKTLFTGDQTVHLYIWQASHYLHALC